MKASLLSLILCAGLVGCGASGLMNKANTGPKGTGFITKTLQTPSGERAYTVFIPHNYDRSKQYPAILFLHGLFESGSDGTKCLTVGLGPAVAERASTFPFITVFAQSTGDWIGHPDAERDAVAALDKTMAEYSIDPDRVILTGMSTGGEGAFDMGYKYANRWAGVVCVCATPSSDGVSTMAAAKVPVRFYHNTFDWVRLSGGAKSIVEKVNDAGGRAEYIGYPSASHDSWTTAYHDEDLYSWMLKQSRTGSRVQSSSKVIAP